jgi:hypothetical protein
MALPPSKKSRISRETPTTAAWQQLELLPDEVMEDILMRLPARSVARCRCLSRAWAAVLSSRGFINRHLDHHAGPGRRRFLLQEHHLDARRLTRSCRGLGLVKSYSTGVYYVCNPSTGQAASLPDGTPVKRIDGGVAWNRLIFGYVSFGLGHDARADRHKVVRLYYPVGLPAGCEVYDVVVGSDSESEAGGYWRPAASGAKPPCFAVDRFGITNTAGVFAQGRVHWLATSRRPVLSLSGSRSRPEPDSVMSFSLVDETFTSIPLPPRACCRGTSLGLTVLHGGRLGLVSLYRHRPRHIWTPAAAAGCRDQMWSQLATVAGSGYCGDDNLYEESLEPVGRPYEDVLLASTSYLHALSMALRRLPARTLGRLKSVCRSWRAVIESDRFASAHNDHQRRLLAASPPSSSSSSSSLADRVIFVTCYPDEDAVPLRSCCLASAFLTTPPLMNSRVVVSKPCHGLAQLMMTCRGERTQLFNPVTRAHRIFAMDLDDSLDDLSSGGSSSSSSSIGLGYDQSTQEHVLVLLAAGKECKVWRLTENVGSARTVPAPPITPRFLPSASTVPPVYIDGRIHWMCCSPRAILAFCVRAGAFQVVAAPPAGPGPGTGGGGGGDDTSGTEFLVELRRRLCVVQSCPGTETITIWSTAGCDGDGAWSREYVIQLGRWPEFSPKTAELVVPMAVEPKDGRILLDTGSSLGYYDPVRRTLETVCSLYDYGPGDPKKKKKAGKRFFAAALWEESLVRPYDRGHRLWC